MSTRAVQVAEPGVVPHPITLPFAGPSVLAFGSDMKSAFCLTCGLSAFLSRTKGELDDIVALHALLEDSARLEDLLAIRPQVLAHDLHPDSRAASEARARAQREGLPLWPVQHHHAHIASCMVDNGINQHEKVIGVAFDGTGYGPDGTIWGGEFLVCDYRGFARASHLRPVPLPGGDAAIRRPYRMALSWLRSAGVPWHDDLPSVAAADADERRVLDRQIQMGINTPLTTSMGRLFDAVASVIGLCHRTTHEAQAAIELESLAAERASLDDGEYDFERVGCTVDPATMIRICVADVRCGTSPSVIASRFHRGVARMVADECRRVREETGINTVALSGGVWQNKVLLDLTAPMVAAGGFRVLTHQHAPTHDGGIALGQAAVAIASVGSLAPW